MGVLNGLLAENLCLWVKRSIALLAPPFLAQSPFRELPSFIGYRPILQKF